VNEFLSFTEEFTCQHSNSGGTITYLLVLGFGDIDQNFGGWVVDVHGAEDSSAIVRNVDMLALRT
jgi:hypothetical protein